MFRRDANHTSLRFEFAQRLKHATIRLVNETPSAARATSADISDMRKDRVSRILRSSCTALLETCSDAITASSRVRAPSLLGDHHCSGIPLHCRRVIRSGPRSSFFSLKKFSPFWSPRSIRSNGSVSGPERRQERSSATCRSDSLSKYWSERITSLPGLMSSHL